MPVYTSSIEVTADYPTIKPSLNLNFARSRSLDPRITFTRASTATYIGRDGLVKYAGVDEARFDHDPETLESLGLLIEESRTNLVTYSEDFSNWSAFNTTVTNNVAVAPDGTTTADLLTENSTASGTQHGMVINHSNSATNYIVSAFFKEPPTNSKRYVTLTLHGMGYVAFDIQTGTIAQSYGGGIVDNGIYPVGDGWYRCWVNYLKDNTTQGTYIILHNGNNSGHLFAGDGVSGMYVWGAQCEEATFPTSYIPTNGAAVTRAQDSTKILGEEFKKIFNTNFSEFSTVIDYNNLDTVSSGTSNGIFLIWGESTNFDNRLSVSSDNDTVNTAVRVRAFGGGQGIFSNNDGVAASSQAATQKLAFSWSVPNYGDSGTRRWAFSFSGEAVDVITNNTGSTVPSWTRLGIGINPTRDDESGGKLHVKRLAIYPKALTDAQLQLLTS